MQITAGYEFMWTWKGERVFFSFIFSFFTFCHNILMLILSAAVEISASDARRRNILMPLARVVVPTSPAVTVGSRPGADQRHGFQRSDCQTESALTQVGRRRTSAARSAIWEKRGEKERGEELFLHGRY